MKRFKNILYIVGTDWEREAGVSEKVRDLAYLNNARVTIVRVEEESYINQLSRILSERAETLSQLAAEQQQVVLETVVNKTSWQDIDITADMKPEKGFIAIIKRVIRDSHDLVIKGSPMTRGVDQLSMRLIRKCPSPVWIIRDDHAGEFRRILAAVDVESDLVETQKLNMKILELTHSLAQREQGEAHCLHVWSLAYETMLRGSRFNISTQELLELKERLRMERHSALHNLLEKINLVYAEQRVYLAEGDAVEVLRSFLRDKQVDVLVMGSIGRAGIPGLLIGNMAERVLQEIACSVLVVKPDGFVSPITI